MVEVLICLWTGCRRCPTFSAVKDLWKEPLLHFVLAGAVLFLVFRTTQPDVIDTGDRSREIVITEGRINQLVEVFQRTWQRPPAARELQGLVDDFVREEIYYREAIALGLDRDDTVIRRRMRQKLEFLSNDLADPGDPGDAVLQAWYDENTEAYREPPRYTLRQVYLDPEKHDDFETAAKALRDRLSELPADVADERLSELGDGLVLISPSFRNESGARLARDLGADFAAALGDLPTGEWAGPVRSAFGFHLVRIDEKIAGRQPELSEVRDAILRDWNSEQRELGNDRLYESLFHRYTVTFENADGTRRQVDAPSPPGDTPKGSGSKP